MNALVGHAVKTFVTDRFCLLALVSCEPDGRLQLAESDTQEYNDQTYQLLQVCLFGHWSYVCGSGFGNNNADRMVALYQLGCTQGGR